MSTTTSTAFFSIKRYPMAVVLLAFILASCGGSKHKSPPPPPPAQPAQLGSVLPLYPNNGANWNDYVKGNDWKTGIDTPNTPCDAFNDTACVHGGELRVVVATGQTSCSGLTASDDLGAFKWVCDASTNPVRLVSTGLADGKNLSDLMDFTGSGSFKPNKVTVYSNGTSWNTTPSSTWWTNPVVKDMVANSGSIALATPSTIYLVTTDPAAAITFLADKIALVIEPGVTITDANSQLYVIETQGYAHLWLEGKIDASTDSYGVGVDGARFSMLRNLEVNNGSGGGLILNAAVNNTLLGVTANHNTGAGIYLVNSTQYNIFTNVTANNNGSYGINLTGTGITNNTFTGLKAGNNGSYGVYLNASNNKLMDVTASYNTNGVYLTSASSNTLADVTAINNNYGVYLTGASKNTLEDVTASNNLYGVYLVGASNNALVDVTASNNSSTGVYITTNSNYNILAGVTSSNNSSTGLLLYNSSNQTLADVASSDNNLGIYLYNSSNNRFTGLLKVGTNGTTGTSNCTVGGTPTNPGLDGTCANNGASDAILTTGITVGSSFVGMLTSDDVANASDTAGATASFPADPAAFDWVHFDNRYRGWGIDGTTHGRWTTGAGRIRDWSLLATDAVVKDVLSLPTGDNNITHTWSDATTTTFLRNAVEIAGDGIGNDNGLCESGETCRYTPNIGSYQGSGNLVSASAFTDGTTVGSVTSVTLMKFATNGE